MGEKGRTTRSLRSLASGEPRAGGARTFSTAKVGND